MAQSSVNDQLLRYCQHERITFTRARPYRRNDNCFVEQKNYTMVRRHVGYQRLSGPEQLRLVNELYGYLRLYANYFQPVMKLKGKERLGNQVKKTYHPAQTPYQRLRRSEHLSATAKQRLAQQYGQLNPAALKRNIRASPDQVIAVASDWRSAASTSAATSWLDQ
jgi:hypothetical protein